jgi:glycosyltransferase involved in cell wall biosynthesis
MRLIDIFVLPSLSEAFSNALLEAMASGCAVVGSNVGGTPELIHDGQTGLLFRLGDSQDLAAKLRRLIEEDNLRQQLRVAAVTLARNNFPLHRTIQRNAELYESLLECH